MVVGGGEVGVEEWEEDEDGGGGEEEDEGGKIEEKGEGV